MKAVVDSIEGEVAVLGTDAGEVRVPRALLHAGAREGDVVELVSRYDPEATRAAKESTAALRQKLSRNDEGGDFEL